MNIPKYRAKKKKGNEYIIGNLGNNIHGTYYITDNTSFGMGVFAIDIDPSTLSINFPDMLDLNNKPIFASLREDGKGGDNATHKLGYGVTFKYINGMFISLANKFNEFKIIGIQQ